MNNKFQFADISFEINSRTFVIAEIGINHNGNINEGIELIKEAKKAGADAVKFQTYITEKRVKKNSPLFDILKKCELSQNDHLELFDFSKNLGIIPFSTPFDEESVDFLESINTSIYKIASFDTVNKKLLRKIGSTNKPVIMSTGMTTEEELFDAIFALGGNKVGNNFKLALLHCISSYPTPIEEANLAIISHLKSLHRGPVGYSDHTLGIEIPIMAVLAGAQIIEKHFTLDTNSNGPDHIMSADPNTLQEMIRGIRRAETILGATEMRSRDVEAQTFVYRRTSD